jgi:hypothetical protein
MAQFGWALLGILKDKRSVPGQVRPDVDGCMRDPSEVGRADSFAAEHR